MSVEGGLRPPSDPGVPTGVSAATRVAGVIGHPVRHSLSPVIHNAAFEAAGLDWVYVAFDVAPGRGGEGVNAMRTLSLGGLSVTMPHKEDAAAGCDRLTARAQGVNAVNTVFWDGDALVGDATDGAGLVAALAQIGVDVGGRRAVVLGAGGAARSAIAALGDAGAAEVQVLARRADAAEAAAAVSAAGRVADRADLVSAAIIVNATPVGMAGGGTEGRSPVAIEQLRDDHVVVDLVYHPADTPLLEGAGAAGAVTVDGVAVLVHQAALQFERWTGLTPPVDVMEEAARAALLRVSRLSTD